MKITNSSNKYIVLGVMSGTSLDGLDLALVEFEYKNFDNINFEVLKCDSISYNDIWRNNLKNAHNFSALEMAQLHVNFGKFIGKSINKFIKNTESRFSPLLICSHGQTIFHNPKNGYTTQIGDGASIAAITNIPTVCDVRSSDVANEGQGAPLVPIGDELLFSEYDFCLNIGGFSNVSYIDNNKRVAFDIVPSNYVLNEIANKLGKQFDKNGKIAKSGKINEELLEKLDKLKYFSQKHPKSLGREWVEKNVYPLIFNHDYLLNDVAATYVAHISNQITKIIKGENKTCIVTGGGAYNKFLIDSISQKTKTKIILPVNIIIDNKEAIIFALIGLLRWLEVPNCLATVTGAKKNSIAGAVYLP